MTHTLPYDPTTPRDKLAPFRVRLIRAADQIVTRAETATGVTLHVRYGAPPHLLVPEVLYVCTDPDLVAYATGWGMRHTAQRLRADPWGCLGPIGRLCATDDVIPTTLLARHRA